MELEESRPATYYEDYIDEIKNGFLNEFTEWVDAKKILLMGEIEQKRRDILKLFRDSANEVFGICHIQDQRDLYIYSFWADIDLSKGCVQYIESLNQ